MYNDEALNIRYHSVGLRPVKVGLVMLQVSRESFGASVLLLTVVGICCSNAWRVRCGMCCGMSSTGMMVDHLVCLLAKVIVHRLPN